MADAPEVTPLTADELAQLQALQTRQAAVQAAEQDAAKAAMRTAIAMPEWPAIKTALTAAASAHPLFDVDVQYAAMCMDRLEARYGA